MRIAIDLDGVCYNFTASLANYIEHMTGERFNPVPSCWEFYQVDWGMSLEEYLEWFEEGVNAAWVFAVGLPAEGCIEALTALKADGHTIHLVTERNIGRRAKINTAEWLNTWHIPYDTLTFADGHKAEILKVDIAVDDRPRNVDQWRAAGVEAYCFGFDERIDMQDHPFYLAYDWDNFRYLVQQREDPDMDYDYWDYMQEEDVRSDLQYYATYSPEDFCGPIRLSKEYKPTWSTPAPDDQDVFYFPDTGYTNGAKAVPTKAEDGSLVFIHEGEIRITDPDTGGQKGQKLARFDLIPPRPLWKLAEHYGRGAAKYAERNWEQGYKMSLSFAAQQRHSWAFWNKAELDGNPYEGDDFHLSAIAFHSFAMQEFLHTHPEMDDRSGGTNDSN
jgi:hypothetical protein